MDEEVTPTLGDLEGVDLDAYKQSLLERFGNINIKDQIDRICSETSAKYPIFILPTIQSQLENKGSIKLAAFVTAAWAIYSLGTNENGDTLNIKDALKLELNDKAKEVKQNPTAFLELESIFGSLKQNPVFTEAFVNAYSRITSKGIEDNLKLINSSY